MNKETIIRKWLDNELSDKELKEFQQMDEYNSFMKIADNAKWFGAPDFDSEEALATLKPILEKRGLPKTLFQRLKPVGRIAAVVVLGLFIYTLVFNTGLQEFETNIAEKEMITLPDASTVNLNSVSALQYLKDGWEQRREIKLTGEAYFKVAKGSKFDVVTSAGIVSVAGTEFNVNQRNNLLEVECYEGKVIVFADGNQIELSAGKSFRILNGVSQTGLVSRRYPSWVNGVSTFKSVPYAMVLQEFERHYKLTVNTEIATDMLFTGSFVHDDQEVALKAITMPFKLNYSRNNNQINLYY